MRYFFLMLLTGCSSTLSQYSCDIMVNEHKEYILVNSISTKEAINSVKELYPEYDRIDCE